MTRVVGTQVCAPSLSRSPGKDTYAAVGIPPRHLRDDFEDAPASKAAPHSFLQGDPLFCISGISVRLKGLTVYGLCLDQAVTQSPRWF